MTPSDIDVHGSLDPTRADKTRRVTDGPGVDGRPTVDVGIEAQTPGVNADGDGWTMGTWQDTGLMVEETLPTLGVSP